MQYGFLKSRVILLSVPDQCLFEISTCTEKSPCICISSFASNTKTTPNIP